MTSSTVFVSSMLPDLIRTANSDSIPIKKVMNLRTVADAIKTSVIFQGMLTEVDKLLRIYFSVPVTSATAERSFSCNIPSKYDD